MDPTFLPAWRLAELIRGGAISCLELLCHYIARIERLDGRTNAVVVRGRPTMPAPTRCGPAPPT
jgi:amidase